MAKAKTCGVFKTDGQYDVELRQTGRDEFTVVYGAQMVEWLTYEQAAKEFGLCVMRQLACASMLDNRLKRE
jgi:hypothetical protein